LIYQGFSNDMNTLKLAQIDFDSLEGNTTPSLAGDTLGEVINKFLPYVFAAAGALLFIYLIAGGFSYMTSGGDPKKTSAAQSQLTNAIIGIIVVLLAFILVQIVGKFFGLEAFSNIFG